MTLLIVALPFLWDTKSSSFLFSEHIFNPWSTFFLLNAICLTAYKIESFAIGIPKQINTNIELCHGKIWLMKMILCSFWELFHLCSDTVNEHFFSIQTVISESFNQDQNMSNKGHSSLLSYTIYKDFYNLDLYNSIEKKKLLPICWGTVYKNISLFISVCIS